MAILIDTSVLIELERRDLELADMFQLIEGTEVTAISVITVSELLAGAHLGAPPERSELRRARVEELIEALQVLDFDLAAARVHSLIWANLRRSGQMISPNDLLIAATALAQEYDVLTENVEHFGRIQGLEVRHPMWP